MTAGPVESKREIPPVANAQAQAVAAKIEKKVEDTLYVLDREMAIMKWPAEFRAIMWDAVAHAAALRAHEARSA